MGAEQSRAEQGDTGIVTVSSNAIPRTMLQTSTDIQRGLQVLQPQVTPVLTPQQQAAADLLTAMALQREADNMAKGLTSVTDSYQSWVANSMQPVMENQARLQSRIDEVATKSQATANHVRRAAASAVSAEQQLSAPLAQLSSRLTQMASDINMLQATLAAVQQHLGMTNEGQELLLMPPTPSQGSSSALRISTGHQQSATQQPQQQHDASANDQSS